MDAPCIHSDVIKKKEINELSILYIILYCDICVCFHIFLWHVDVMFSKGLRKTASCILEQYFSGKVVSESAKTRIDTVKFCLIWVFGYAALKTDTHFFYILRHVIDQDIWNGIWHLSNVTVNFSMYMYSQFMYFILKHGEEIFGLWSFVIS